MKTSMEDFISSTYILIQNIPIQIKYCQVHQSRALDYITGYQFLCDLENICWAIFFFTIFLSLTTISDEFIEDLADEDEDDDC